MEREKMKPHEIIRELETSRSRIFKKDVLQNFLHDKDFQEGLELIQIYHSYKASLYF